MTNLDSILKSRAINLPTKVHLFKAMVFPVVMYGCECWTVKKAECWRIGALGLWCWWRLLRVSWTARRSNQSILKENSPEYSLEGLMLKLKFQYFDHLMWRTDSFDKTLLLGKIEGRRRRGRQWDGWMASLTQWTWVWVNSGSWWWTGRSGVLQCMGSQRAGKIEWLNWTLATDSKIPCRYEGGGLVLINHPLEPMYKPIYSYSNGIILEMGEKQCWTVFDSKPSMRHYREYLQR